MWVIAAAPRGFHEGECSLPGGFRGTWQRVRARGGDISGIYVPDTNMAAEQIRTVIPTIPNHWVLPDADVESPTAPKPIPDPDADVRARLVEVAERNGWEPQDIAGTWTGETDSERAYRSPVSGLNLIELTQTRPPRDWERVRRLEQPPWASGDWHPPYPGWVAPHWSKGLVTPESPTMVVTPPVDPDAESPTELFDGPVHVDEDEPTQISVEPIASFTLELEEEHTPTTPEPDYPHERVEIARGLLKALSIEIGKAPSMGRANHKLKAAGLPKIPDAVTLNWLLED
jgi:hypothetical protein